MMSGIVSDTEVIYVLSVTYLLVYLLVYLVLQNEYQDRS